MLNRRVDKVKKKVKENIVNKSVIVTKDNVAKCMSQLKEPLVWHKRELRKSLLSHYMWLELCIVFICILNFVNMGLTTLILQGVLIAILCCCLYNSTLVIIEVEMVIDMLNDAQTNLEVEDTVPATDIV